MKSCVCWWGSDHHCSGWSGTTMCPKQKHTLLLGLSEYQLTEKVSILWFQTLVQKKSNKSHYLLKFGVNKIFLKEIDSFILQGHIKFIITDKDIYNDICITVIILHNITTFTVFLNNYLGQHKRLRSKI